MMPTLAVTVLAVAWFAIVMRRSGGRLDGLVLGALPLALLFITLPLTVGMWRVIGWMQTPVDDQANPALVVIRLLNDVSASLGFGSVGAVLVIGGGLALQLWHSEAPDDPADTGATTAGWPTAVLYCGTLLIAPAAFEAWMGHSVLNAMRDGIDPSYLTHASRASIAETSNRIASVSTLALTSGVILSGVLAALACVNLGALGRGARVKRATVWTWTIVAIVLALAGWNVSRALGEMRPLHTATTLYNQSLQGTQ